jgi:hypothetical protein
MKEKIEAALISRLYSSECSATALTARTFPGPAEIYPPSGVKLRPSERRYKPYIVVLWVRPGTLPAGQLPGRFAIRNLTGPEA